jgi:hypothetical protein
LPSNEQEFYYQVAKADAAQFEYIMAKKRRLYDDDEKEEEENV